MHGSGWGWLNSVNDYKMVIIIMIMIMIIIIIV